MLVLSKEYLNTICQVHTMSNSIVGVGKISEIQENYIIITNPENALTIQDFLSCVKITLRHPVEGYKVIIANVSDSQHGMIRLSNLALLTDSQKRHHFRVHFSSSTNLYLCNSSKKVEKQFDYLFTNEEKSDPIPNISVKINNLSLGGVCFESDEFLQIGQDAVIEIVTQKRPQYYLLTIKRRRQNECDEYNDTAAYYYGCSFNETDTAKMDDLCRLILEIQSHLIRKVKKS